jgi:ATP-dependent Lon protease
MKLSIPLLAITSFTAGVTFICSYFWNITMANSDQYLAIVGVMFLDGTFGMILGLKEKDFKPVKQLKY